MPISLLSRPVCSQRARYKMAGMPRSPLPQERQEREGMHRSLIVHRQRLLFFSLFSFFFSRRPAAAAQTASWTVFTENFFPVKKLFFETDPIRVPFRNSHFISAQVRWYFASFCTNSPKAEQVPHRQKYRVPFKKIKKLDKT
jgi:hypothetical protein